MKLIRIANSQTIKQAVASAADILKNGGLIIYPTDTAYGLGANALDETAVKRVFKVKRRPLSKPIHIIVKDIKEAKKYAEVTALGLKLAQKFLPGPLTLIFKKKSLVPDILTANLDTIGIRIPNHPVIKALSAKVDFPYTATSANLSGENTPYCAKEVLKQLDKNLIGLVVDAGELPHVEPSTVLDLTISPPKMVRKGPISLNQINRALS